MVEWVEAVACHDCDAPVPSPFELLPRNWPKIMREPMERDALAGYAVFSVTDVVLGVARRDRGEDDEALDDDLDADAD
jgi:hypothetical protein